MLKCGPYSKDCLIVLRNVSFQEAGYLLQTLFRTLLHPHAGPLSHHTAESETLPTTKWVSQWAHWKNSGHTCLSLRYDSAAVRNKVVCSTWPRSVTALLKLWSSTSATRRMCLPIHVGLFREWKTTTLSRSWSVWVVIIRENGVMLRFMWKWGCTDLPYTFHPSIIGIYYMDTSRYSTGEAVVEYFSGQTDVHPDSCGSFQRMEDDNSKLAMECESFFARRFLENLCALTN